jgi:hypothetical protein
VATEEWRTSLRQEAVGWLAERFPGSFDRLAPGQLPTIEFLLTDQLWPWEPDRGAIVLPNLEEGDPLDWAEILDLKNSREYWQCTTIPSLRLQERSDLVPFTWPLPSGIRLGQRNRLVLAALEREFIADPTGRDFMADPAHGGQDMGLFVEGRQFAYPVSNLLVRWSLTALIRELEEQIADIQDAADQASRKRSSRALAKTQRQLLQTGIDSRIVVNDIIRYARVPRGRWNELDFTKVASPDVTREFHRRHGQAPPTVSLTEFLQKGQITNGQRVSRLETDLREVLNTSAQLASASENIRLQRLVVWLTVIATIVAIIAVAVAVMALRNSNGSAPPPSRHATNSSMHAPASPRHADLAG